MDVAVSVFFVELVAPLNPFLEGLFKPLPVLCTNGFTHGMKMRLDETVQVLSELRPESSTYSEPGDDLVELVLRQLPVKRLRARVEHVMPFSDLFHQMRHTVLRLGWLSEAKVCACLL